MTSDSEVQNGSAEMKSFSVRQQQLVERSPFDFNHSDVRSSTHQSSDNIKDKLNQLLSRKISPQMGHEETTNTAECKEENSTSPVKDGPDECSVSNWIDSLEPCPSYPAPTVILDTAKFPTSPCKTQCPACQEFITTETVTSISSATWTVCCMAVAIGCVAGCCLIPFCMEQFKSITHKCPKCRTSIHTIKKL